LASQGAAFATYSICWDDPGFRLLCHIAPINLVAFFDHRSCRWLLPADVFRRSVVMGKEKQYWLMKSEPDVYSIDDLARDKETYWEGVRNYQARNFMRDQMQVGDEVLYYHSNCKTPGVVGTATVCKAAYPDDTSLDPSNKYFDPKSTVEKNRWVRVDLSIKKKFSRVISLTEMKAQSDRFSEFKLLAKGNRLSVLPVSKHNWDAVLALL